MRLASCAVFAVLVLPACSTERSLRVACERGDPAACDVLSARYAYGDGVRKDPDASVELAARAMELCARSDAGADTSPSCARFPRIASVPLDLPAPSQGAQVQTVLSIVLAADGTTSVDGKNLPNDDAILALAQEARAKNPEIRAVIKADSATSHGRVIHVLDLLKQAQIGKIAFGVTPVAPVVPK